MLRARPPVPFPRRSAAGVRRSLRTRMAVRVGALAGESSRLLRRGEGGIIGGRLALALAPGALAELATGRRIAVITGTNGKTTTAHLLAHALGTVGPVAHNATGANMADGVAGALMADQAAPLAVLEVDEMHLGEVTRAVRPELVVLLNLTRDQLDRNAEVSTVAAGVREALLACPGAVVVANCDDPVVTAVATDLPRVRWVAAGTTWLDDATLCPRCQRPLEQAAPGWRCPNCGLGRPEPAWAVTDGGVAGPDGLLVPLTLRLPGAHNRGNAALAVAAAEVLGVPAEQAVAAMSSVISVHNRYAVVEIGNRRAHLLLAKNPAGWRETLPLLRDAAGLLLAVNAREADGRDTSWLWDVPFEELAELPTVASGEAAADLGLRLSYAGVAHGTIPELGAAFAALPEGDIAVVANYTAFTQLTALLGNDA